MFSVNKAKKGDILTVDFIGEIDEFVRLQDLVGETGPKLHVNCRQLTRMNSNGIREWHHFFKNLRKKGVELRFLECPPAIMRHANFLPSLILKEEVVSVCVAFRCDSCGKEELTVHSLKDLSRVMSATPTLPCPNCKQTMELDDLPEDYQFEK